ncbi:hypothetical protein NC652_003863 [Populus alba x Populus x berolinensis]|nr:hypothetical protein NC651_003746 [Populus alba x Populus x berolinensis]KAJ6966112.1 hypothetical protein NC652_003863 [Populus alba x Populus x berolinensis]
MVCATLQHFFLESILLVCSFILPGLLSTL